MRSTMFAATAAIISGVTAHSIAPGWAPWKYNFQATYDAYFDNLYNADPADGSQPVNFYYDLYYNAFDLVTNGAAGANTAGLKPHSGAQDAYYGQQSILQQGTPALLSSYNESRVAFFSLQSFYFGCTLNVGGESAASVPQACNVTAVGYDYANKAVAQQTFSFVPDNPVLADMQLAKPDPRYFQHLDHVNFTTSSTGGPLVATGFDDFVYTLFYY